MKTIKTILAVAVLSIFPATSLRAASTLSADSLQYDNMFAAVAGKETAYVCREFKSDKEHIKKAKYTLADGTLEIKAAKASKQEKTGVAYEYTRKYTAHKKFEEKGDFDSNHRIIAVRYTLGGKAADGGDGYASATYTYEPRLIMCSYYDTEGKPVNCKDGYSTVKTEVEANLFAPEQHQKIMLSESYFDKSGAPALCPAAYHKKIIVADNNQIRVGFRSKTNSRAEIGGYSDIVYRPSYVDNDELSPVQLLLPYTTSDCRAASCLLQLAATGDDIDLLNHCYNTSFSCAFLTSKVNLRHTSITRYIIKHPELVDYLTPDCRESLQFIHKTSKAYANLRDHLADGNLDECIPDWTLVRYDAHKDCVAVDGKKSHLACFNANKSVFVAE